MWHEIERTPSPQRKKGTLQAALFFFPVRSLSLCFGSRCHGGMHGGWAQGWAGGIVRCCSGVMPSHCQPRRPPRVICIPCLCPALSALHGTAFACARLVALCLRIMPCSRSLCLCKSMRFNASFCGSCVWRLGSLVVAKYLARVQDVPFERYI